MQPLLLYMGTGLAMLVLLLLIETMLDWAWHRRQRQKP